MFTNDAWINSIHINNTLEHERLGTVVLQLVYSAVLFDLPVKGL